jgi:predicted anti-sigma-YlaC factor YlaD
MMDCDGARRTLSAALDDEASASRIEAARRHAGGCPGCRLWIEDLHEVNRALRIQEADVPDLTASILEAWDRWRAGRAPARLVRVGLAIVGMANLLLAALFLADVHAAFLEAVEHHTGRELAAFSAALAAAFLLSAWDGRAHGRLGVVGTAILLLVLTAAADVASSRADLVFELVNHFPNVVGFALLVLLHRLGPFEPSTGPRLRRPRLRRHLEPRIREAA